VSIKNKISFAALNRTGQELKEKNICTWMLTQQPQQQAQRASSNVEPCIDQLNLNLLKCVILIFCFYNFCQLEKSWVERGSIR
jgi:hypothetical protein